MAPRESLEAANQAFIASLALYDSSLESLQGSLEARYDSLRREGYLQTLLVVFILAASILLVLYINRVITGQINEINRLFKRISVGDLQARAKVTTHDELGAITVALNQMLNDTLALVQSREERDSIQISIEKLLADISGVAEGDLTKEAEVTADVTGSIADSFNYMIEQLRDVIAQVQNTILQVSAAATEIQDGADLLEELCIPGRRSDELKQRTLALHHAVAGPPADHSAPRLDRCTTWRRGWRARASPPNPAPGRRNPPSKEARQAPVSMSWSWTATPKSAWRPGISRKWRALSPPPGRACVRSARRWRKACATGAGCNPSTKSGYCACVWRR